MWEIVAHLVSAGGDCLACELGTCNDRTGVRLRHRSSGRVLIEVWVPLSEYVVLDLLETRGWLDILTVMAGTVEEGIEDVQDPECLS